MADHYFEGDGNMDARLHELIDKEDIRELVLLYSRSVDRKDVALLRDLYTADASDEHGDSFAGPADKYCDFIEQSLPYMPYSAHHVCNHLISVDGDVGSGEVYALAVHYIPDRANLGQNPPAMIEDFMCVRYIDNYRREADGKWRFAKRVVTYDLHVTRPFKGDGLLGGLMAGWADDPSYAVCEQSLFQRGARG